MTSDLLLQSFWSGGDGDEDITVLPDEEEDTEDAADEEEEEDEDEDTDEATDEESEEGEACGCC